MTASARCSRNELKPRRRSHDRQGSRSMPGLRRSLAGSSGYFPNMPATGNGARRTKGHLHLGELSRRELSCTEGRRKVVPEGAKGVEAMKRPPRKCRHCRKLDNNQSGICDSCWRATAILRDPSDRGALAWAAHKRLEMDRPPTARQIAGAKNMAARIANMATKTAMVRGEGRGWHYA